MVMALQARFFVALGEKGGGGDCRGHFQVIFKNNATALSSKR
jgi:hypothetical protein